jgi:ADP-ribose pyrophosphatase YjhB (NUDIX family)
MPKPGTAAVVFDDAGRILLVRENDGRRRYAFQAERSIPARPQAAVVREAREESGVDVAVEHLVGLYGLGTGFWVRRPAAARAPRARRSPSAPATPGSSL